MALNFSMASIEAATHGVKCLIYGPAGIGKTVLTATMPVPILISAESGALSLKKENLERLFGVGNPQVTYDMPIIKIANVQDLSDAYAWLAQSQDAKPFMSVGLDSITEIAEVVLNNAKRQVKDPRQAYGELIEKMQTLIRLFRDLPGKNVLVSAKMEHQKDEISGTMKYMASMPGAKLGQQLPYFFDEVFRYGVGQTPQGEKYRFLQTQPDLQYDAKDRSGALDPMEYPFLASLFQKIQSAPAQ